MRTFLFVSLIVAVCAALGCVYTPGMSVFNNPDEQAGGKMPQDTNELKGAHYAKPNSTENLSIDHSRTAVLIMDYQTDILGFLEAGRDDLLKRASRVLQASRDAKIMVIYIAVGFRRNYPEISPRNTMFTGLKQSGRFIMNQPGSEIHPMVAPKNGEVIVLKHRVGAFVGTDLDMILRSSGIETLVLFGISTSGVVLSTLRYAADLDYRCIVIKDCCGDRDLAVHNCLTEKVFPRQATIVTVEEFLSAIRS
ncbi:MAG TPA: isochorismatase family cysteine hydrolase [Syntrophobacteraceae bacterium]|nr:isochorismatase family cysteine hydrolase [Syntrophobacteraceae bacterium]